ncbi:hypothetical protein BKA61DRAFT_606379 [Leptodontidium sp. MPI-SDFR-AT-0119]|nr:hypothetical protein BKA61DRAFT_606379 [Leptodontidium sp. MPI-SDFR-AT-0119]
MLPTGEDEARHTSNPPAQRTPYWEVLELDHPGHLECYRCKKLHHINDALAHLKAKPWTKCGKDDQKLQMARYIHPEFNSTIFRMIIKQSRQGKDVGDVIGLLSYRGKVDIKKSQVAQMISDPRIIGGRLLMRSQTRYIVSPSEAARTLLLNQDLLDCPHNGKFAVDNIRATQRLAWRFEMHKEIGRQEHIINCRCDACPTEFDIFLERFEGQGIVLFIVEWQDIGTGLAPLDKELQPVIGARPSGIHDSEVFGIIEYESPRARFEGVPSGESMEAAPATLTSNEREKLFKVHSSWQAKLFRCKDRIIWPIEA